MGPTVKSYDCFNSCDFFRGDIVYLREDSPNRIQFLSKTPN